MIYAHRIFEASIDEEGIFLCSEVFNTEDPDISDERYFVAPLGSIRHMELQIMTTTNKDGGKDKAMKNSVNYYVSQKGKEMD